MRRLRRHPYDPLPFVVYFRGNHLVAVLLPTGVPSLGRHKYGIIILIILERCFSLSGQLFFITLSNI